jgi:hypothetical protein
MLERMENDYVHHWNMLQKATVNGWRDDHKFNSGACYAIVNCYAMLLDCTFDAAHERLQERVKGATC